MFEDIIIRGDTEKISVGAGSVACLSRGYSRREDGGLRRYRPSRARRGDDNSKKITFPRLHVSRGIFY